MTTEAETAQGTSRAGFSREPVDMGLYKNPTVDWYLSPDATFGDRADLIAELEASDEDVPPKLLARLLELNIASALHLLSNGEYSTELVAFLLLHNPTALSEVLERNTENAGVSKIPANLIGFRI